MGFAPRLEREVVGAVIGQVGGVDHGCGRLLDRSVVRLRLGRCCVAAAVCGSGRLAVAL